MNNLTTIYVVRHGQSQFNIGETDKPNTPLTAVGRDQAQKLAEELKDIHFDAIFSSTLLRTKETAEILKLERKLAIEAKEAIVERSSYHYTERIGRDEKEVLDEIKKDLAKLDELQKMEYKHSPIMESAKEAATRTINFLREIAIAYSGKTVLVVAHGNIMRNVLTQLGTAKYDQLPSGSIPNTGYFVLESDGIDFFVKELHNVNLQEGKERGW